MKSELLINGNLIGIKSKEDIDSLSKIDLISKTREVLKLCKLCTTHCCECVKQRVQCSAEVCGCLKNGFRPGFQQSCGNPEGLNIFDPDTVNIYRSHLISSTKEAGELFVQLPTIETVLTDSSSAQEKNESV